MATITDYFAQAQLSMAAYAVGLQPGMFGAANYPAYVAALVDAGMSDSQATKFADTYTVIDQFTDPLTGFSATIFSDSSGSNYFAIRGTEGLFSFTGALDWLTNVGEIGGAGIAIGQGLALFNYLQRLQGATGSQVVQYYYDPILGTIGTTSATANGLLSGQTAPLSVTGDSLGGHLAMMLSRLAPGVVSSVYTYNAPGFDEFGTGLTSEGFFSLLQNAPIGPITGAIGTAWNSGIMSHLFVDGDIVHTIGTVPGGQQRVFSELENQGPVDAHNNEALTDSLAIYNLFATLDPGLNNNPVTGISKITEILMSSSNNVFDRDTYDISLENALDALRTLFQENYQNSTSKYNAGATQRDGRDDFYTKLFSLQEFLKGSSLNTGTTTSPSYNLTVDSLTKKSTGELITAAKSADLATRYALYKLNPFTVSGTGLYETINTDNSLNLYDSATHSGALTDEYLKDRAAFLYNKIVAGNKNNDSNGKAWVQYIGSPQHFQDGLGPINYQLYLGPDASVVSQPTQNISNIIFDDWTGNTLTGGDQGDKLYGLAGNDTLQGNKGIDYLEGGQGTDTYIYVSGDGTDTLLDTDHQGQIQYDTITLNGGKKTGDTTYRSQDGQFLYTLIPQLGTPYLLGITGPDGNLLIQDFTSGDLNITLAPADPLAPPQNALTGDQSQPGQNDDLDATAGTDAIYGLGGDDILSGHAGQNGYVPTIQLYGGTGNDILYGEYFYTAQYYSLGPADFQTQYGDQVTLTGPGASVFGEAGNDTLLGSLVDDTLDGGVDADYLEGELGNDTLIGGTGNDILNGNEGRDVLQGDANDDRLGGGAGADVLLGGTESDTLYGDANWFQPVPWDGVNYVLLTGTLSTMTIPIVKDVAEADAGDDILDGGAGEDWLYGGAGNDLLDGGTENDQLQGEGGDDILYGGAGNDKLWGDSSANAVTNDAQIIPGDYGTYTYYWRERHVGLEGNDYLDGGAGDDQMWGGGGNDQLVGGTGADWLHGGLYDGSASGNDILEGGDDIDYLFGEDGNDLLYGGAGDDFLYGGTGADILDGGTGADDIYLDGQDRVILDGADFVHKVDGTLPIDLSQGFSIDYASGNIAQAQISQVLGSDGRQWLQVAFDATNILYLQNGFLDDGQRFDFGADSLNQQTLMQYAPAVNIAGTDGNDTIYGSNNTDTLSGGVGSDTLSGQVGDDSLDGGIGADILIGGVGNDTYIVDDVGDVVTENANEGTDTVQSSVTYTLSDNVENLTLTGAGLINGTGNILDNVLTGNTAVNTLSGGDGNDLLYGNAGNDALNGGAGDDTLDGGTGQDMLTGGLGNDAYVVDSATDIVIENLGEGNDTIQSSITRTLDNNVENLILTGTSTINGTGNALDNVLTGNIATNTLTGGSGNDILDGGAGNDTLIGGLGDDNYIIDNSGDVVTENLNEGSDTIQSSITRTLDSNVENLTLTGTSAINGTGNILSNVLTGNSGNNTLTGGDNNDFLYGNAGVDILDGGTGNDLLDGGAGNDTYRFGRGSGQDVIEDNDVTVGNLDTIQMGTGVLPTDITIERNSNDLVLKINGTTDQLTVRNFSDTSGASSTAYRVERVTFTGSSEIWDTSQFILGTPNPEILIGTAGDNKIFGYVGDDNLEGLAGNDLLDGGAGNDIMIGGDGYDTYVVDSAGDVVVEVNNFYGESNTVQSFIDYTLGPNLSTLILLGTTANWATGNELHNTLTGNDADNILTGGMGNDNLSGGGGSDTYIYNIGDGQDSISSTRDSLPTSVDAIQFGSGIRPEDVVVNRFASDSNLLLSVRDLVTGVSTQAFTVTDGFNATYGQEILDEVRFAEGSTVWQRADLYARYLTGGDRDDTINAFDNRDDVILGNDGDDRLSGASENDDLSGGAGNDVLFGGLGNDTYHFGLGQGHDEVVDNGGEINRVVLDAGILPGDVTLYRTSSVGELLKWHGYPLSTADDLVISIGGGVNQLQVKNYFASPTSRPINQIVFSDGAGTIWGDSSIDAQLINLAGTANTVTGSTQDNQYTVDHRNDIVSEPVNGGIDTVTSNVTYTLPANVENLTLSGPLDIGGNGNVLANTIRGNDAANYLNGVSVGDTFIGGGGDDFYVAYGGTSSYYNFDGTIIEAPNEGYDTVLARSYSASMPANVEKMIVWSPSSGVYVPPPDGVGQLYLGNELDNIIDATLATKYGYGFVIDGGLGADLMIGPNYNGTERTRFIVDNPNDVVVGTARSDDTIESAVSYVLPDYVERLELKGSSPISGAGNIGNNTLDGSQNTAANALAGGIGDDTYIIGVGDTVVENSNEGTDTIQSGFNYTLGDYVENLTLTGTSAISGTGNTLNNVLSGSQNTAANTLAGGLGDDTYILGAGDSIIENANEGIDTVNSSSTYTLGNTLENLTLTGTTAINGTGNGFANTLTGNSAANVLAGLAGDDIYVISTGDTVVENANEGTDTVQSYVTYTLDPNVENLTIVGAGIINGTGNDLNNVLTGNSDNNAFYGLAGNDTLTGNAGDDALDGGDGADTLYGGTGNDTYIVDAADTIAENFNEGIDTVNSSITYTLGANLENLILTGAAAINGTGNSLNNILTGNSAANILDGRTGADAMAGGLGDDIYIVDVSTDIITENANEGADTVQSSVTHTLGANVENLTLTGSTAINGTGNVLNNTLDGASNSAANVLTGLTGNDTYVIGTGDTVTENLNEGTDTVQSSITYTLGANLENLTLTGSTAINGTGNELNNVITGNSSNNALYGLAGNDSLTGNTGNDTLNGGTGNDSLNGGVGNDIYVVDTAGDTVTELANEGTDTVRSSIVYTLGANVENLTLTGTTAIDGTGNELNNVIIGNSAGNIFTGGAGNDTLGGAWLSVDYYGAANTYSGGTGNDILNSTIYGDTYLFNLGDGQDTIYEWDDVGTGGIDILRFGPGIEAADLNFTRSGETLVIAHQNGLDSVTVGWWYYDTTDMGVIERMEFDDGTAYALTGMQFGTAAADTLTGTVGGDVLVGLAGDDSLSAGEDDDLLYGGDGSDTLDGGMGYNQLFGGMGDDTYQARLSSEYEAEVYDFISDSGGSDKMVFGPGINPSDIQTTLRALDPVYYDYLFLSASTIVGGVGYRYDAVITDWGIGNELNPFVGNEIETFIFLITNEAQPVSQWG